MLSEKKTPFSLGLLRALQCTKNVLREEKYHYIYLRLARSTVTSSKLKKMLQNMFLERKDTIFIRLAKNTNALIKKCYKICSQRRNLLFV